jgi:uncharacterized protein (DUF488 family)
MHAVLYTIGYERADVASFLAALVDAGVSLVMDIREIAHSRRPGFSKRSLQQRLEGLGLGYVHLRHLGDPR